MNSLSDDSAAFNRAWNELMEIHRLKSVLPNSTPGPLNGAEIETPLKFVCSPLFEQMDEYFVRNGQAFRCEAQPRTNPFDEPLRHKIPDARLQFRSVPFLNAF